jgi:hypothetical protein
MHDGGKKNRIHKHGGKSKGKGVVDVVVTRKMKTHAQSPTDDYELTFIPKKGRKRAKVEHQTLQKGLKVKDITILHGSFGPILKMVLDTIVIKCLIVACSVAVFYYSLATSF